MTRLVRSVDAGKDQSYVLAVLTSAQLSRAMFPLGDTTKEQVRKEAADRGPRRGRTSPTATTSASSPTAIPGASCTGSWAARRARSWMRTAPWSAATTAATASPSASARACGIDRPAADGRPRFVLSIEPVSRTVTVGPAEALDVREIEATRPVWSGCLPPAGPVDCLVQLRAHGEVHPAVCEPDGDSVRISLREPARGIAPGQAAVFYDGDAVLGSATIARTS